MPSVVPLGDVLHNHGFKVRCPSSPIPNGGVDGELRKATQYPHYDCLVQVVVAVPFKLCAGTPA